MKLAIVTVFMLILVNSGCSESSKEMEESLKDINATGSDFMILSPAYKNGGNLPKKYTCKGDGISPPIKWFNAPKGTKSFALIYKDPDAPSGLWTHWVVYDIPSTIDHINEGSTPKGAKVGKNEMKANEFTPPCPPNGVHRYIFDLYALDVETINPKDDDRTGVESAVKDHTLGKASIEAKFGN